MARASKNLVMVSSLNCQLFPLSKVTSLPTGIRRAYVGAYGFGHTREKGHQRLRTLQAALGSCRGFHDWCAVHRRQHAEMLRLSLTRDIHRGAVRHAQAHEREAYVDRASACEGRRGS